MNPIQPTSSWRLPVVVQVALWTVCSLAWLSPAEAQKNHPPKYEPTDGLSRELEELHERLPQVARLVDILTTAAPCNLDEACFATVQARCLLQNKRPPHCADLARSVCCEEPKLALPFAFSPAPPPAGGAGTIPPSIVQEEAGGYRLSTPRDVTRRVPFPGEAELTVHYRAGGHDSIRGEVWFDRGSNLHLRTKQRLKLEDELVQVQLGPVGGNCGSAEFGIGCYLAWCPTEVYCLPGPGDGGFECRCL